MPAHGGRKCNSQTDRLITVILAPRVQLHVGLKSDSQTQNISVGHQVKQMTSTQHNIARDYTYVPILLEQQTKIFFRHELTFV